eukprot:scaffold9511_cov182-Skeletonema_dohrnii-CCMP3373.AAC.10
MFSSLSLTSLPLWLSRTQHLLIFLSAQQQQHLASEQNESKQTVDISKKKRASAKVEMCTCEWRHVENASGELTELQVQSNLLFITIQDSAAGKQRNSSGFSSE